MNKHILFVCLFLILLLQHCKPMDDYAEKPVFPLPPGDTVVLHTLDILADDSINITKYMELYLPAQPAAAIQSGYWQNCNDSISIDTLAKAKNCWFSFTIENNSPQPFTRLLCPGEFDYAELFSDGDSIQKAGDMVPLKQWSYAENKFCLKLVVNGYQTKRLSLFYNKGNFEFKHPLRLILRTEQNEMAFQAQEMKWRMTDTAFFLFYLGFLTFCFIYFLAQYMYRRKEQILIIYALYIFFTLMYSFRDIDKHYFLQTSFPAFNGINVWGEAMFSYLAYIFYSLFIVSLLNLKEKNRYVYFFIIAMVYVIIVLFFADLLLRIFGQHQLALKVFHRARGLLFPLTILYFLLIIPLFRNEYYTYFLFATIFVGVGTAINLLVHVLRFNPSFPFSELISSRYGFWGNPVNYTRLGVIGEVIFFSLGLSRKIQLEYARSAVLNLSGNYTGIVFHEIKNGLNKLIGLIKLKSSDSIKFIHELNDVLTDSLEINEAKISLTEELEIAKRYFNFRAKPHRDIELAMAVDREIEPEKIMVPPLLLQPFIENCIKHAFPNDDQTGKKVNLIITLKNGAINIEISDNGVGFTQNHINTKSKGIKLVRERLRFFNEVYGANIYFETANLSNTNGAIVKIYNLQKDSYDKSNIG